jgi:thiamine-phosphate pyrophosphorylase
MRERPADLLSYTHAWLADGAAMTSPASGPRDLTAQLGVYIVTGTDPRRGRGHLDVALAAIAGGADAVQLRAPELTDDELLPLARTLAARCATAGVLFVVNDRLDVAVDSGAAGVHLGQDDDYATARSRLGADRLLGVSVATVADVSAAEAAGADYLGVTVWPSPTKPEAIAVGLAGLRAVTAITKLPVVGIGGIVAGNAEQVLGAGATGVAVSSAVNRAEEPAAAVRRLATIVRRCRTLRTGDGG